MSYYRDLREFLDALDKRGMLHRYVGPIDKDRELLPLIRIQQRGVAAEDRRVFLFDDVRGAVGERYEMRVAAGVYGASEAILQLGMCADSRKEMDARWHHALENPIAPVVVENGPVQEIIHTGPELKECGLDAIPSPVEEPGFSQVVRVGMPILSRDPETGARNAGAYNAFLRDRDRMVAGAGVRRHLMRHWSTARRRGEDLPVAIVIGATPNIMLAASTTLTYGTDEMEVAGGYAGEPVEMVRCATVALDVPAHAEIVIEGMMSTRVVEPRLGFGEYPGYLNVERNSLPVITVTAITHRRDAIFTPILVAFPPVESTTLSEFVISTTIAHHLTAPCGFPIEEVHVTEMGGGSVFCVLRLQKGARVNNWSVLQAAASFWQTGKYFVLVDYDINPSDSDVLLWALSWRVRPEQDITIERGRHPGLDPSFGIVGSSAGHMGPPGTPHDYFKVLIDATMKEPFPPVALPARQYMERALELWKGQPGLPEPRLREPWYGYTNGFWSEDDQRLADLISGGDYKAVGHITAEQQSPPE